MYSDNDWSDNLGTTGVKKLWLEDWRIMRNLEEEKRPADEREYSFEAVFERYGEEQFCESYWFVSGSSKIIWKIFEENGDGSIEILKVIHAPRSEFASFIPGIPGPPRPFHDWSLSFTRAKTSTVGGKKLKKYVISPTSACGTKLKTTCFRSKLFNKRYSATQPTYSQSILFYFHAELNKYPSIFITHYYTVH